MPEIRCSNCQQIIDANEKFCPHCGHPVKKETAGSTSFCPKCGHENPADAAFCEQCGTSLKTAGGSKEIPSSKSGTKVLHSTGSYTGTMIKGKTSKSWKIFKYTLFIIILIAIVAFIVWYNTDPNAKETLGDILFGGAVMLFFAFIIWRKSKKGGRKKKRNDDWDEDDRGTLADSDDDGDSDFDDSDD